MNKGLLKKGFIIGVETIIGFMGARAVFINWLREKTVSGVHTERQGLVALFPDFPQTEELYWVSTVEKRSIGAAKKEVFVYAVLEEDEFAHFIEGTRYSEVERLPLFFQPKQIKGPFNWQEISDEGEGSHLLSSNGYQRTIYVDLNKCLIFIEANITKN